MSNAPSAPDLTRCRGTRERAGPESARTCRGDRGQARAPGPAVPPCSSAPLGATAAGARAGGPLGELHMLRPAVVRRRQVAPLQRSEEHTSELQSPDQFVCRLLLEKKKKCLWN